MAHLDFINSSENPDQARSGFKLFAMMIAKKPSGIQDMSMLKYHIAISQPTI